MLVRYLISSIWVSTIKLSKINRSECFSGVKGHCSGRGNFIYRIDSAKFSRRILFRGLAFSKIWRKQFSRAKAKDADIDMPRRYNLTYARIIMYVYNYVYIPSIF